MLRSCQLFAKLLSSPLDKTSKHFQIKQIKTVWLSISKSRSSFAGNKYRLGSRQTFHLFTSLVYDRQKVIFSQFVWRKDASKISNFHSPLKIIIWVPTPLAKVQFDVLLLIVFLCTQKLKWNASLQHIPGGNHSKDVSCSFWLCECSSSSWSW